MSFWHARTETWANGLYGMGHTWSLVCAPLIHSAALLVPKAPHQIPEPSLSCHNPPLGLYLKTRVLGFICCLSKQRQLHTMLFKVLKRGFCPPSETDMSKGGFSELPKAGGLAAPVHAAAGSLDRKSTRLNSSHSQQSRMPSSA